MARQTVEEWIPVQWDSTVIKRITATSAVEALARRVPMSSETVQVPRSGSMTVEVVAKGAAYGEDVATNDTVLLTARKFGKTVRFAQEDIRNARSSAGAGIDIVRTKMEDWGTAYARTFDNATLGVTGTSNGTTIPFTSVYKAVRTANADTGYVADANYIATGGNLTYQDLSDVLAIGETSDYYDEGKQIIIAHPSFKGLLRTIVGSDGHPILTGGGGATPSTLFETTPIRWSLGARTSPTMTGTPTGNPLLIVANRDLMILGDHSGPESATALPDSGVAFMTDEQIMKMRCIRGFAVGHESGFAVIEKTAS
jgi:HK97 family phage major capsid protein